MIATLYRMTSGECRWIGREDIHVYCHAPLGRQPLWQVVTATTTTDWIDAPTAAREIESLLAQEIAA